MKLILLALLIIQVSPPPTNRGEQEKPTYKEQQGTNPQPAKSVYIFNNQDSPAEHKKESPDKAKQRPEKPPWWDVVWATWALVVIGGAGVIAALATLGILWMQTTAIMNAERAWILVDWENFIHINPESPNGVLSHCFTCYFRNVGKSPAFVKKIYVRFIKIKSLNELPEKPDYRTGKPRDISAETEPVLPDKKLGGIYAPLESTLSFEEIDEEHRSKKCVLFAYGFIQYEDIHGRKCETRFGLAYEAAPRPTRAIDGFRFSGPKSYHRYTN